MNLTVSYMEASSTLSLNPLLHFSYTADISVALTQHFSVGINPLTDQPLKTALKISWRPYWELLGTNIRISKNAAGLHSDTISSRRTKTCFTALFCAILCCSFTDGLHCEFSSLMTTCPQTGVGGGGRGVLSQRTYTDAGMNRSTVSELLICNRTGYINYTN